MTTTIHVIGTIATDPKLITTTPSGKPLCSFRLASDERRYDREKQEWINGGTNWFGVVAFRGLASHAHESFNKGDRIIVTGRLKMRSWEKEERKGVSVEIEAEALGHDVRWGVSKFEKRSGQRVDPTIPPETADGGDPVAPADHGDPFEAASTQQDTAATPEQIGWKSAA